MATLVSDVYRRPLFGPEDGLFHRCLVGSAVFGMLFLIAVVTAPIRKQAITSIEQLPERFARLIVDKPKPHPMPPADVVKPGGGHEGGGGRPAGGTPDAKPIPAPANASPPPIAGRRVEMARPLDPGVGMAGRARAREAVASQVASATASLERSLATLSTSLRSSTSEPVATSMPGRARRGRMVGSGRSEGELASARTDLGGGGSADLSGSAVDGAWVTIGSLSASSLATGYGNGTAGGGGGTGDGWGGSGTGSGGGNGSGTGTGNGSGNGYGVGSGSGTGSGYGSGAGPGVYRSNASLLAVIQRYAAGIQFCYGNELKRNATLSGKLVVALTVAASGQVLEARIVQNTIGSERLASCALSQIKDWKFPAVPQGVTTFQAPFVFTPPN